MKTARFLELERTLSIFLENSIELKDFPRSSNKITKSSLLNEERINSDSSFFFTAASSREDFFGLRVRISKGLKCDIFCVYNLAASSAQASLAVARLYKTNFID